MTNLDNILKSRDITLSTKVCLVKGYGFSSGYSVIVENKHAELELKVVSEKHINSSMNQIFWKLEEDMQMTPPLWQKVKTN